MGSCEAYMNMHDENETTIESIFAQVRVEGRSLVARLRGPSIAQRESELIAKVIAPEIESADSLCKYLVLDMEDVEFLSSMGIGLLIDLQTRAKARKMKTVLSNVGEKLDTLLRLVKLEKVLTLCRTEQEFAKAIKKK